MRHLRTAIVFLSNVIALVAAASPAGAGLPFWTAPRPNCDKPLCGYEPFANTSSAPVYFGTAAGGFYNHAAMLTIHKDSDDAEGGDFIFTVSWKNAPVSEDTPGQRVLYAQSRDGLHFGPARVLFPNMSTALVGVAQFAGPFATVGGRLYATATPAVISGGDAQGAQWCLWPDGQDPRNCATPNRPGTQPSGILLMRRILPGTEGVLGPVFWVSPDGPQPNVYAAAAAANGVLPLSSVDAQTRADVATLSAEPSAAQLPCDAADGTLKCEGCVGGCQLYEKLPTSARLANERSHWQLPNGSGDVMVYRSHSKALWAAARLGGKTQADWPLNVTLTNIPNDDSNLNAGSLGAGRGVYIVSNAAPNKVRDPLTVAIARDGRNFSSCRVVQSCTHLLHNSTCTARSPTNKNVGPSYPQALTVVDPAPEAVQGLYVVATNNKEDVVITRIPWSSV